MLRNLGKNRNETIKSKRDKEMEMTEDDVNKLFGESPRALPSGMLKEKVNQKLDEKAASSGAAKKAFSQT